MVVNYNSLNKKQQRKVTALCYNVHKLTDFDLGILVDICMDELMLRDKLIHYFSTRSEITDQIKKEDE